jgi:hypothetical protein
MGSISLRYDSRTGYCHLDVEFADRAIKPFVEVCKDCNCAAMGFCNVALGLAADP